MALPSSTYATVRLGHCGQAPTGRRPHQLASGWSYLDRLRQVKHRGLVRVADVDRAGEVGADEPHDAFDQIIDVDDGTGLRTISRDRDRLARQCLRREGRDRPTVLGPHPGTVRVEDP